MTCSNSWIVRSHGGGSLVINKGDTGVSYRYSLRKESFTAPFGSQLPPLLDDLIDLAAAVYSTDRLVRRHEFKEEGDNWSWQRQFEVHLAVSEPERWNCTQLVNLLTEALEFLTEDSWSFKFFPRDQPRKRHDVQGVLFSPSPPIGSALFSGGLDSFAGLASQIAQNSLSTMVVCTCASNSRLLRRQRGLLEALSLRTSTRLVPVIIPIRIKQDRHAYNLNEQSQRGRGFLFVVLGCVASLMAGVRELSVYENGVGAINLPLSEAQLGAQSSRATNPVALWKLEKFLSSLLQFDFLIRLPHLFLTKGQMCAGLRSTCFESLALRSISCDGFPFRSLGAEQCGVCTSCLLRRQALWSSELRGDNERGLYRYDVVGDGEAVPLQRNAGLWDMLSQVDRMDRALWSSTPWERLSVEFPELSEIRDCVASWLAPLPLKEVQRRLVLLYKNYCHEWHGFPARPPGWSFSFPDLLLSA